MANKKLIQSPPVEYIPLKGMMPDAIVRDFRGVNTFDSLMIPDNQFTDMANMTTADYPAVSVRPGYTALGTAIGTKVLGLGVWKDTELHTVFSDGTWRKWTGATWTTLASGLSTSAEWSFTNFQGNQTDICLFGCNGVNGLRKYDGATVTTFGDAPADLNYITTYQNRLWGASGKELHSCALDLPAQWQQFNGTEEDSYVKDVETIAGEMINMVSGSLTKLTIGTKNSVWELYGGLPSDFNTVLITNDEGFSNNKSAMTQEGEMSFIDRVGIFNYAGGTIPNRAFSDIMRRYFATIDGNSVAGSDGRNSYFKIATDTILFYDDRAGITSWSVWRDIRASQFAVMAKQFYIGDDLGRVLRLEGTSDNGTPISWSVTTKPFTGDSISQKMKWIKLWITVDLSVGSTLNVSLSPTVDGNDFTLVKTVVGTGLLKERIVIPITGFQLNNTIRIKLEGTGFARIHEISRRYRLLPLY